MSDSSGPSGRSRVLWGAGLAMGAMVIALLAAVLFKLTERPTVPISQQPVAGASMADMAVQQHPGLNPGAPSGNSLQPSEAAPSEHHHRPEPESRTVASRHARAHPYSPQTASGQITPAPAQVCAVCGTVIAVTAQRVEPKGSGLGAIAGGLVGGLLGNQVGGGNGRTAATVVGAIGGGFAGNAIEKRVNEQTVYDVQVRLDSGHVQTLQLKAPPPVGQRVQVEANGTLSPL